MRITVGVPHDEVGVSVQTLVGGKRSVSGWASGSARDSQDALEFSDLRDVTPAVEEFELNEAGDAYAAMYDGDVRFRSLEQPPQDAVYFPVSVDESRRALHLAVRTGGDPRAFTAAVRQEIWAMDPNLPIADPRLMGEILADSMQRTSFTMVMLGIAAAVALLLGTLGIYGVVSYAVSRRTREMGIRIALGATAGRVRRTVVREGLVLALAGVAIGTVAAATLSGVLSGLLFEVSASDPLTYMMVAVVLVAGAALASYVPARRASAVDPMEALRQE